MREHQGWNGPYVAVEYPGTDEENIVAEFQTHLTAATWCSNSRNFRRRLDVMKITPEGNLTTEY